MNFLFWIDDRIDIVCDYCDVFKGQIRTLIHLYIVFQFKKHISEKVNKKNRFAGSELNMIIHEKIDFFFIYSFHKHS
jgi:hypothetical protein